MTDTVEIANWMLILKARKSELDRQEGVIRATHARALAVKDLLVAAQQRAEACEQASLLMASYADARQIKIVSAIETIVSAGLTSVFGEPIDLKIVQAVVARRVEIRFVVVTDGLETSLMDARGGGLVAVASWLLKATVLMLTKDARRIMVLDETFAHLSAEYAPKCADFIAQLAAQANMQVVLVTHDESFVESADTIIRMQRQGKKTVALVESHG